VRRRLVSILQRLMLRTGRGPLRPLWRLAHEALARGAGLYLRGRDPGAAVYVRASLGVGDPVYGLSDIDLAVAIPGGAKNGVADRERRLQRWSLMLDVEIYEERDLQAESAAPVLTHGLKGRAPAPVYRAGLAGLAPPRLQERPGLYGPLCDWRLLVGPEHRPQPRDWMPGERSLAAWLELQFWWRQAFRACVDPPGPRKPYLCVKLVAEPARILLWLVHGERIERRKEILERALRLMPEEEASLRMALATLERLPDVPEPPLEDAMRSLVRQSSRLGEVLSQETADAGATQVRLVRTDGGLPLPPGAAAGLRSLARGRPEPELLPLTDWRARAMPSPLEPDETFAVIPGDPADPGTVGAAATVAATGPYPALRFDGLLVLAARSWWRSRLRAPQCAVSDPVSFALMAKRNVADFPNASGWSAQDSARRAVAEHMVWLEETPAGPEQMGEALARLLAAARAAHFLTSIEEGAPALPVTLTDAGRALAGDDPGARAIAEQACGEYEAYRVGRSAPSEATVAALRKKVLRLPAYGARAGA
jgi:hypothetical protein